MRCKSKKGEGSTFYFTVKFCIPPPQTQPKPQTPQNETNSNPFFRTSVCTVSHAASPIQQSSPATSNVATTASSSASSSAASSLFVPSPLAHSKKHSQAVDLPSSMELLQDALLNKAASMRLMPPPARNSRQFSGTDTTTSLISNKAAATATTAAAASGVRSSSSLKPPSVMVPHLGLLSPNAGVILPPRTPSRGAPLRILAVSDWHHARDTIIKHLRAILGGISQHQDYELSVANSHIEAVQLLAYPQAAAYDYIVINLALDQQVLDITRVISGALQHQDANVLVITTPMQRSLIMESAKGRESELLPSNCSFVFKPIKRSKLNWYFGLHHHYYQDEHSGSDQEKQQSDGATGTRNMNAVAAAAAGAPDSSRQRVATQKEVFRRMEADVGGKGFRVMLVEGKKEKRSL